MRKLLAIIAFFVFAATANAQFPLGFYAGSGGSGAIVNAGASQGQMLYWDNTAGEWKPATDLVWDEPNTSLILPMGTVANPAIAFGDGDSGFTETADDTVAAVIANVAMWQFRGGNFESLLSASGPMLRGATPTATAPNIRANQTDPDTGIGWSGADTVTIIGGSNQITDFLWSSGPAIKDVYDGSNYATRTVNSTGLLTFTPTGTAPGVKTDGAIFRKGRAVAAAIDTVLVSDHKLRVAYTATGAVAIAIPAAQIVDGRELVIIDTGGNAGANNITITPGSGLINGAATFVMNVNRQAIVIDCDGTNCYVQ